MEKLLSRRAASTRADGGAGWIDVRCTDHLENCRESGVKNWSEKEDANDKRKNEREQKRTFVQHTAEGCVRPAVDFKKNAELPRQGDLLLLKHNRRGNYNALQLNWLLRGERQQCFRRDLHTLSLHEHA